MRDDLTQSNILWSMIPSFTISHLVLSNLFVFGASAWQQLLFRHHGRHCHHLHLLSRPTERDSMTICWGEWKRKNDSLPFCSRIDEPPMWPHLSPGRWTFKWQLSEAVLLLSESYFQFLNHHDVVSCCIHPMCSDCMNSFTAIVWWQLLRCRTSLKLTKEITCWKFNYIMLQNFSITQRWSTFFFVISCCLFGKKNSSIFCPLMVHML